MFLRQEDPHHLAVSMTGVKMGDRLAYIGCADAGRLAALTGKVGLSGRAVAVVPDETWASRVTRRAERAGVLIEIEVASPTRLPLEDDNFDLVVIDDAGGLIALMRPEGRVAAIRESGRVLRRGGR